MENASPYNWLEAGVSVLHGGFHRPRARMDPPLPTEGRGRRGMEGDIAEDRISLHKGSLVKVGRRVRNGDPCTPAQSVVQNTDPYER